MTTSPVEKPVTSVPLDGYDSATDALAKAGALLSTLSCAYDDKEGVIPTHNAVWMTILAATDLVDAARISLEMKQ